MPTLLNKLMRFARVGHDAESCKAGDDITSALLYGTMMVPRVFLAFCALLVGAGYLLGVPGWWTSPIYRTVIEVMPMTWWGAAYLIVGLLSAWRVVTPRSRPFVAYLVNSLQLSVWCAGFAPRLLVSWESLFSLYLPVTTLALVVLLRTEATARDTRTA